MATIPLNSISARARKGLVVRQFIVNFLKVVLAAAYSPSSAASRSLYGLSGLFSAFR